MNHLNPLELRKFGWNYFVSAAALTGGLMFSIISWLQLCYSACLKAHSYKMFGFSFEAIGIPLFAVLLMSHLMSRHYPLLASLTSWLLAASLGAEIIFLYFQKYVIGAWCPLCLCIAGTVIIASVSYIIDSYTRFKTFEPREQRRSMIKNLPKKIPYSLFFLAGFLFAFFGISKENPLQAGEAAIKESIAFGDTKSQTEVFVFTDWACPACRAIEPKLGKMSPTIMKKARLTFVDFAVHPETLNYTPYNLAFMVHNKPQYLKLRAGLTGLSKNVSAPTEQQIEKVAGKGGAKYQQLNYSDVDLGVKYFKHLATQFDIVGTPTIVIVNHQTKKGKKLTGTEEISEANVIKAIDSLNKK